MTSRPETRVATDASAPPIQFCRNRQGRRIAFAVVGSGPPLVCPAWWVSHLEEDFRDPSYHAFFGALARHHQLVVYDRLGVGLSDRDRSRFDLEEEVDELTHVVDHLALARFALLGISCGAPTAVELACRSPDRVERLILYGSYLHGEALGPHEIRCAVSDLVRAHWGLGSKTIADLFAPDLAVAAAKRLRRRQRASASPDMAAKLLALTFAVDVRRSAPGVTQPTLVLHRRGDMTVPFENGRVVAAAIPGACFVPLEGNSHVPWEGDTTRLLREIETFLGDSAEGAAADDLAPQVAGNELTRAGNVWTLRYAGRSASVAHLKGLADLRLLLAHPNEELGALDLSRGEVGTPRERTSQQEVVDGRALAEYRARLDDIDSELETARSHHDVGTSERLQSEREALLGEVMGATGLGRRRRTLKDPAERARKAVSARIQAAIARIAEVHPSLARHLEVSIRTGTTCRYAPESPTDWRT